MVIKQIEWTESDRYPIVSWIGRLNGKIFFVIDRFRDDHAIMTSRVVPMKMRKDSDISELKEAAQILTEAYINSLVHNGD